MLWRQATAAVQWRVAAVADDGQRWGIPCRPETARRVVLHSIPLAVKSPRLGGLGKHRRLRLAPRSGRHGGVGHEGLIAVVELQAVCG